MGKRKPLISLQNLIKTTFLSDDDHEQVKPERKRRRIYKKQVLNVTSENNQLIQIEEDGNSVGKKLNLIINKFLFARKLKVTVMDFCYWIVTQ